MLFTCLCLLHLRVLTCLKLSILNSSFMVPEFLSAAEENPCPVEDFLWFLLIKKKKNHLVDDKIELSHQVPSPPALVQPDLEDRTASGSGCPQWPC